MATDTYLSIVRSKKQNKQNRNRLIDTENIWQLSDGRGFGGWVKKVKGLRSTDRLLQNSYGDLKYSTGNTVHNSLILCMVPDGCKIYQDDHLESYVMSNYWGAHLKPI